MLTKVYDVPRWEKSALRELSSLIPHKVVFQEWEPLFLLCWPRRSMVERLFVSYNKSKFGGGRAEENPP